MAGRVFTTDGARQWHLKIKGSLGCYLLAIASARALLSWIPHKDGIGVSVTRNVLEVSQYEKKIEVLSVGERARESLGHPSSAPDVFVERSGWRRPMVY